MKIYAFLILLLITTNAVAQKIQVNDTIYVNISEDKYSKDESLSNGNKNYKVATYFTGSFRENIVVVMDSTQAYFKGLVSEFEANQDSVGHTESGGRYFYIMSGKTQKDLVFLADGQSILIPFIRGYRILLINAHLAIIDGVSIMQYSFRFTNRFAVRY
jgi:hypothetical protein